MALSGVQQFTEALVGLAGISQGRRDLGAFDKHCGKGQQTITVEHVKVEARGQMIVASVNTNQQRRLVLSGTNLAI